MRGKLKKLLSLCVEKIVLLAFLLTLLTECVTL